MLARRLLACDGVSLKVYEQIRAVLLNFRDEIGRWPDGMTPTGLIPSKKDDWETMGRVLAYFNDDGVFTRRLLEGEPANSPDSACCDSLVNEW